MDKPVYVVVTPFFPSPSNWQGAYCYDFVMALKRTGKFDVRVFVPGADGEYDYEDVRVTTFRVRQLPSAVFPFFFKRFNQRSFLSAILRSGTRVEDVAVCHGHTAFFSIYPLAVKTRNPRCLTLLHHHDPQSFGLNLGRLRHLWLYNLLMFPVLRRLHEKIDCHVFISEMVRRSFLAAPDASWTTYEGYRRQMRGLGFYRGARIKRGVVLSNGVDSSRFSPFGKKPDDVFTIGCIGNFVDWKDQISLLRAFCILRKLRTMTKCESCTYLDRARVVFIGSGPERAKCEKYARAKGLDVEFRDEVMHDELPEFYRSLDLFVLPSYFEGFGCVFTEAYACGVPFITCEGQGIEDLICDEDRDTWLCQQRNPDDLAAKIRNYIQKRPIQQLKGEFDIDKLVSFFACQVDAFRQAIGSA